MPVFRAISEQPPNPRQPTPFRTDHLTIHLTLTPGDYLTMGRTQRIERKRKELRNKLVTRGELQDFMERYDRANVAPLRRWHEWKRAPLYRRVWALTKAWWKREWAWPPRRPSWARLPRWIRRRRASRPEAG